jgi:hypothetical protein
LNNHYGNLQDAVSRLLTAKSGLLYEEPENGNNKKAKPQASQAHKTNDTAPIAPAPIAPAVM